MLKYIVVLCMLCSCVDLCASGCVTVRDDGTYSVDSCVKE